MRDTRKVILVAVALGLGRHTFVERRPLLDHTLPFGQLGAVLIGNLGQDLHLLKDGHTKSDSVPRLFWSSSRLSNHVEISFVGIDLQVQHGVPNFFGQVVDITGGFETDDCALGRGRADRAAQFDGLDRCEHVAEPDGKTGHRGVGRGELRRCFGGGLNGLTHVIAHALGDFETNAQCSKDGVQGDFPCILSLIDLL